MKNSALNKIATALVITAILGALTTFVDFQLVKAQVVRNTKSIGASHKNNKLLCFIARRSKLSQKDQDKLCL